MKKIFCGIMAMTVITATAHAADWNFYGSAIVNSFYTDVESANAPSATNLEFGLSGESLIGAQVKVNDQLSGLFELGAEDDTATIRYLYGLWNFGSGALLIGQDDGTLAHPGSDQVYGDDAGLGGWGEMASGRKAQIKLIFGGFRVAFREPDATYNNGSDNVSDDTETKIPSIEARYDFSGNNWNLAVNGGYHSFEVGAASQETITSYVVGLGADVTVGSFVVGGNVFGGRNVGNLVDADVNGQDTGNGYALYSGGRVVDNDALAWKLHMTYTINDMVSVHGGYGYMKTELDTAEKDDVQSYYVQVPLTLTSGVCVVPEIGVVDYKQETADNKITYIGAKWQVEF